MYEDLSAIQVQIFDFIREELSGRGYPPSVREIGAHVGLASTSSVHHQLNKLESKGYIKRDPQKPRAMEILKSSPISPAHDIVEVPIIGTVRAGEPILAYEEYEDTFPLPSELVRNSQCFMLNVTGNSMINAGILDGDYVIVRQQPTANNGEIVVAMIEDGATVKTFYREADRIRLQPENPMLAPIYSREVTILGKVIGVIRMM